MSNVKRDAVRAAKRAAYLLAHPRCVICSDPITLKPGRNLRSRTCSKRACTTARYNWMRDYRKPVGKRFCAREDCRQPIPVERNANSKYCSLRCNHTVVARRQRAKRAA